MMIAGRILFGMGVWFLLLAIIFVLVSKKLNGKKGTSCTKGRFIGMCCNAYDFNNGGSGDTSPTGRNNTNTYYPIFAYWVNGMEYHRASNVSYNMDYIQNGINQGQTVDVYYNTQRPQEASLTKNNALSSFVGKLLSIVGYVFLFVGIVLLILGIIFLIVSFI